jgi:outer membrane biosynthesis protein TonB
MFKSLAFAGLMLALLHAQATAQQPTEAQRDAIRAACRSDFMAYCSGVQPGGKDAFECLLRNDTKLSPSCQAAANAAAPKPAEPAAAAATPEPAAPAQSETAPPASKAERAPPGIQVAPTEAQNDQLKSVQQACTLNDFVAHCSWIAPNNPEILLCLKGNAADLSSPCQAAVQALAAAPPAAVAPAEPAKQAAPAKKPVEPKPVEPARTSAPPAPPAPAAPAASAAAPTAQQKAAVRASCRSDFMSHCSGVQPGGAEALQCLKHNEAQLSAACRSAVAAIGGGAGAAAAPSGASAATAAPPVAPLGPMPMLRPRDALAIVQICGPEVRSLCAGVPFGGGRVISCLAANASSLSPSCYGALSAAAGR